LSFMATPVIGLKWPSIAWLANRMFMVPLRPRVPLLGEVPEL
jgi:hypothetical protein